ncbi:YwpF-like family protein [Robertmurraya korlensis]|uniref:YwpF-like family protein n=1 Tax=Robertmurraya korlensis TaxID=519977 RepID=UPI000826CD4B|nr:YwpF-like family protein [Robertmurraya korlensis]
MKTFKLISLQIIDDSDALDITLYDGLIINKEDERNRWLIEAYVDSNYHDFFTRLLESEKETPAQVVISKKENDPATFTTRVLSVKKIDGRLSVLFEGFLKRSKNYAELLLSDLIEKGLSGEELLNEFREKMLRKPKLTSSK